MGAHAEWTENLVAEIDSMSELRQKENELRKILVNELRSDARDFVGRLRQEHHQRARELRNWLRHIGADVRAAAELWVARSARSARGRSRPSGSETSHGKGDKKKGRQR